MHTGRGRHKPHQHAFTPVRTVTPAQSTRAYEASATVAADRRKYQHDPCLPKPWMTHTFLFCQLRCRRGTSTRCADRTRGLRYTLLQTTPRTHATLAEFHAVPRECQHSSSLWARMHDFACFSAAMSMDWNVFPCSATANEPKDHHGAPSCLPRGPACGSAASTVRATTYSAPSSFAPSGAIGQVDDRPSQTPYEALNIHIYLIHKPKLQKQEVSRSQGARGGLWRRQSAVKVFDEVLPRHHICAIGRRVARKRNKFVPVHVVKKHAGEEHEPTAAGMHRFWTMTGDDGSWCQPKGRAWRTGCTGCAKVERLAALRPSRVSELCAVIEGSRIACALLHFEVLPVGPIHKEVEGHASINIFLASSHKRRHRICRHFRHPQLHYYGERLDEALGSFPIDRNWSILQRSALAASNQSKRQGGSQPPEKQRGNPWRPCRPVGALPSARAELLATAWPTKPAHEYCSSAVAPKNLDGLRYRLPREQSQYPAALPGQAGRSRLLSDSMREPCATAAKRSFGPRPICKSCGGPPDLKKVPCCTSLTGESLSSRYARRDHRFLRSCAALESP